VGELLSELSSRGATVKYFESGAVVQAPVGKLDDDFKCRLRSSRRELEQYLQRYGWILDMTLSEFERGKSMLEVAVPGLGETLWFVPSSRHAEQLRQEGIRRGRVWTSAELRDLLAAPGLTHEAALSVARAKLAFSGTVVEVRPSEEVPPPPEASAPAPGALQPDAEQAPLDLGVAVPTEHDL
jgi:hypothetical protein